MKVAVAKKQTTVEAISLRWSLTISSLNHLVTISNIVKRLFSKAKLIVRDQRKLMEPQPLELLLFLRCNKFYVSKLPSMILYLVMMAKL